MKDEWSTDSTGSIDSAGGTNSTDAAAFTDVRAAKRAQKQAEKAARAQQRADEARQRAVEAARAGGIFGAAGVSEADLREPAATAATPTSGATDGADAPTRELRASSPRATARPRRSAPRLRMPGRRGVNAMAIAAVLLLVLTALATWQYREAKDAAAAEQHITEAPKEATDSAREIVTQMFTYDHRTVDGDLAKVRDRLVDPALKEFVDKSMPAVASSAKQEEATVFATVAAAAPVESPDVDHATVLVMLNRMVSTKANPKATSSASRLEVQMARVDGVWKLAHLKAT